jgi:hypothetical protein
MLKAYLNMETRKAKAVVTAIYLTNGAGEKCSR